MLPAMQSMLDTGRLWRGRPARAVGAAVPTGLPALDALLPQGGWPLGALTEILLPVDGVGELQLLWPTLATLSRQETTIALVAPPYLPYAPAWAAARVVLPALQVIHADEYHAAWAAEQCLRSGACTAVVLWPRQADDRQLRRLQLAAEAGQCLGFVFRPAVVADTPSSAVLRLVIETQPARLRVLKCRGANPPTTALPLASFA